MYSKTLSFTNESDITFQCSTNYVEIFVNSVTLGKINHNFPVTVYVTVNSGGNKAITMEEISNADYTVHNNANRTVIYNHLYQNNGLHVSKCSSSNRFVTIGIEDENFGVNCSSGISEDYFDISASLSFKAKMETTTINNQTVYRMFVRYGQDIANQCGTNPVCGTTLFCYKCI